MRNRSSRFLAALAIVSFVCAVWPGAPARRAGAQNTPLARNTGTDIYAITNARIVTVSGPVIERGTIIIRNGLIEAVGASVAAPADARPIDGTGLTIYPGLIDANTTLAIPRPTPTPAAGGGGAGGGLAGLFGPPVAPSAVSPNSTQLPGLQPEIVASDIIRPGGTEIESARSAGITAALTAPRGNIFLGQSALINLAGETPQQMIVSSPVALHVGFTSLAGGVYPGSLMGVFASIRQALLDAQRYRESNAIYERSPRGLRRPGQDKSLAALQPVLARQMPVVMQAEREREIIRALDLAQEFNLQLIIAGGMEAYKVADRLKAQNVPVLLSLNFPRRTTAASIGSGANDGWLWTKVRASLLAADDLRDSTIDVDVDNAVVSLSGTVANGNQKVKAAAVAKGVDGVKSVTNKLTIKSDGAAGTNSNANANRK